MPIGQVGNGRLELLNEWPLFNWYTPALHFWYVLPCPMGLPGNAGCSGRNQEVVRKEGRLLDIVGDTDTAGG